MKDKKTNIVLPLVLIIMMVSAITIIIMHPNETEKTIQISQNVQEENKIIENEIVENISYEYEKSMQQGGRFCKIENKIVFYDDENKSIYLYDVESDITSKIITLDKKFNKMYFDGEFIYYLPYYYDESGIYKIDLQGNKEKIYDGYSLQLCIYEDKIYFVQQIGYDDYNQNPQGNICVIDKNGENFKEIVTNIKNDFFLKNKKIYYTSQDRKLYEIDLNGENQQNLSQGRKFVEFVSDDYLIYVDYSNQEAKHILNLETKEDKIIGYYGQVCEFEGKAYITIKQRVDDGSIEEKYSLLKIENNNTVIELLRLDDTNDEIKNIYNNKIYMYNENDGIYIINIENMEKEISELYKGDEIFLNEFVYKVNKEETEEVKLEKIEL